MIFSHSVGCFHFTDCFLLPSNGILVSCDPIYLVLRLFIVEVNLFRKSLLMPSLDMSVLPMCSSSNFRVSDFTMTCLIHFELNRFFFCRVRDKKIWTHPIYISCFSRSICQRSCPFPVWVYFWVLYLIPLVLRFIFCASSILFLLL